MAPGVGFHCRTRDAPVSPPAALPDRWRTAVRRSPARAHARCRASRRAPSSPRRARASPIASSPIRRAPAPRSGRVAGRRARVGHRPARPRLRGGRGRARGDGTRGRAAAPRPLEPLVYHFAGDSATIVSARTGQLVRRGFRVTDAARFGGAVNNNAVSVFSLKARDGSPREPSRGRPSRGRPSRGRFPGTSRTFRHPRLPPPPAPSPSGLSGRRGDVRVRRGRLRRRVRRGRDQAHCHQAQATGWAVANERTNVTASARRRRGGRRAGKKEKKDSLPARVVTKNVFEKPGTFLTEKRHRGAASRTRCVLS